VMAGLDEYVLVGDFCCCCLEELQQAFFWRRCLKLDFVC
jgi:hypothetical protein